MALSSDSKKSTQNEDLEERLEALEKLLERTKVMFEQYFMGIQRVAPMQLHRDIERRVRELTQAQIRNTGMRFRITTLTQKFGSYNTYWKRTLREIEQGRYVRDLKRLKRKADMSGDELPDELLAKLPKLTQDRIRRERARLAERAMREGSGAAPEQAAFEPASGGVPGKRAERPDVHRIDQADADALFSGGDLDMDALFGALTSDSPPPVAKSPVAKPPIAKPPIAKPPVPPPIAKPPVPPPMPKAPPPRPSAAPTGMDESKQRDFYERYNRARAQLGDTSQVSYDALMKSLANKAPTIMRQHAAKGLDWDVVVRDNKVVVKAKPVK